MSNVRSNEREKPNASKARKKPNASKARWKKPEVRHLGRVDKVVKGKVFYTTDPGSPRGPFPNG